MVGKTGIVERASDKSQPFRVWFKGNIVWFARTKEEAEAVLEDHRKVDALNLQLRGNS